MSSFEKWLPYFKSEARTSGTELFRKGAVVLSSASDTAIQIYVKGSTPCKISLQSESIESSVFFGACTCPLYQKGNFCKHLWAALLLVQGAKSDFLVNKTDLQRKEIPDRNSDFKNKQNEYRKQQYEKQKRRLKEQWAQTSGDHVKFAETNRGGVELFFAKRLPPRPVI